MFQCKPTTVKAITFDALTQYGLDSGAGRIAGMPVSFMWEGYPVTTQTKTRYAIGAQMLLFTRGDFLVLEQVGQCDKLFTLTADEFAEQFQEVDPAKHPGKKLSPAEECLMVISHYGDFQNALQARMYSTEESDDPAVDYGSYWQHQLDVLERMKKQAETALGDHVFVSHTKELWVVAKETAQETGLDRPETMYAVYQDCSVFDTQQQAQEAILSIGSPVGFVALPLRALFPRMFTPTKRTVLSPLEIRHLAEEMPGGLLGYGKTWGYETLARQVESAVLQCLREAD